MSIIFVTFLKKPQVTRFPYTYVIRKVSTRLRLLSLLISVPRFSRPFVERPQDANAIILHMVYDRTRTIMGRRGLTTFSYYRDR